MVTIDDQITEIEEEIFNTQKNKATEHHLGKLKAKLAKLKAQLELNRMKSSGGGKGYYVKKSGDATVALVGWPSVGKSSLLNYLTAQEAEVASYRFTTLEIIPGIMEHKGARIQILDMPGIIRGASRGKGRGKEVITAARASDLILLMGDVYNHRVDLLRDELYSAGIRLDRRPPDITLTIRDRGGIIVRSTVKLTRITEDEAAEIVRAYGIVNAVIVFRENANADLLVDFLAGNRVYIPSMVVVNKWDMKYRGMIKRLEKHLKGEFLPISVKSGEGLEELKEKLYNKLGFISVFLKPQGKKADMDEPMVLLEDSTVRTICEHLHREFVDLFRYALIWGKSAKYPGQSVGMNHQLEDRDLVTIVLRRV